jgi:hypothetical protein
LVTRIDSGRFGGFEVTDVLDVFDDEPLLHAASASASAAIVMAAGKERFMEGTVAPAVETVSDAAC